MKIFQVITVSEYGGAQSIVANLLSGFSSTDEMFVLYGGEGESWVHLPPQIKRIRLSKHRKELSWKDIFLLMKLFYYRLKYRPDIVHLHSSKMGAIGRIAFNPKKIVYTIHGFDSIRKAFRKFLFVEKFLKNRAASIVAVSAYDVQCLAEEGIKNNVTQVYNGLIDHFVTDDANADSNVVEKLNSIRSQFPKIVMCISRISKQKKFDLFLDIAVAMPQYAFVWIGNKEVLTSKSKNVFILGETHAAYMYLNQVDLFILPSNYEGLPVSIIEALSHGVPVVASAVGGVTEMLDAKNGFAVENTVADFEEKINLLLQNETFYTEASLAARKSYLDHFTIKRMIEGYADIYKLIITKR